MSMMLLCYSMAPPRISLLLHLTPLWQLVLLLLVKLQLSPDTQISDTIHSHCSRYDYLCWRGKMGVRVVKNKNIKRKAQMKDRLVLVLLLLVHLSSSSSSWHVEGREEEELG